MEATNPTRTVVVTGASTGIGEACALRLDRNGWRVFAGVRREADAERVKSRASDRLATLILDVTNQAQIDAARQTVEAAVDDVGLHGLVNNAGISVNGPLEFLTPDDLRRQFEVNVVGQMAMTQAFLSLLRRAGGRIVNVGSIAGRMASPFLGPYGASKHAMEALTDALRQELRPWGLHVAIVEPGAIATEIWQKGLRDAEELERNLPEEAMRLYGKAFNAIRSAAREFEANGIPPDRVAQSIEHALTASKPRTRYVVGFDASVQRVLRNVVPDRLRDWLVAQRLKLPNGP